MQSLYLSRRMTTQHEQKNMLRKGCSIELPSFIRRQQVPFVSLVFVDKIQITISRLKRIQRTQKYVIYSVKADKQALHALSLLHAQNLAQYQHYSSLPKSTAAPPRPTQPQPQRRPQRQSRQRSLPKAYHSVTSSTASLASMVSHARVPPIREDGSMLLVNRFPPNQYTASSSPQQVSPPSSQASNSPTESTASSASNAGNDSRDRFLAVVNQLNAHFSSYALAFARAPVDGTPLPAEYGGESFFDIGEHLANGAPGMD